MRYIDLIFVLIYIIIIILNSIIIYYLNKLEYNNCKCIKSWRHNFIKYVSIIFLIIYILILIISLYHSNIIMEGGNSVLRKLILIITCIITPIVYFVKYLILNKYIKDINSKKCNCVISNQKKLHKFLYMWSWIPLILLGSLIIFFIGINILTFPVK
jgi:hypothetical protein